jgi:hypothetical protein
MSGERGHLADDSAARGVPQERPGRSCSWKIAKPEQRIFDTDYTDFHQLNQCQFVKSVSNFFWQTFSTGTTFEIGTNFPLCTFHFETRIGL